MIIPKLPIPMPPLPISLEDIIKAARVILDIITGKPQETAGKVSEKDAMKEGSENINDISDINKAFDELIVDLKPEIQKIESGIIDSLSYYLGDFISLIEEKEAVLKTLKAERISRKFERLQSKFKGTLQQELYKEISLDNQECRDILALPKGEKKRNKTEQFIQNSINVSLQSVISRMKEDIMNEVDDIENEIRDNLALIESKQIELKNACEKLQNSLDENGKHSIKNEAINKIATIEALENFLEEEM